MTGHPGISKGEFDFERYGVDGAALAAFARQLNYELSPSRASKLLGSARRAAGLDPTGGTVPEDADVLPVLDFLKLFEAGAAGAGGGAAGGGGSRGRLTPNKVDALSERERQLLADLRESLFERHSQMKTMFEVCDRSGDRSISVEEFLKAMERAGSVVVQGRRAHEIDRGAAEITEEEACNIVGFFDASGDGSLSYDEVKTAAPHTTPAAHRPRPPALPRPLTSSVPSRTVHAHPAGHVATVATVAWARRGPRTTWGSCVM